KEGVSTRTTNVWSTSAPRVDQISHEKSTRRRVISFVRTTARQLLAESLSRKKGGVLTRASLHTLRFEIDLRSSKGARNKVQGERGRRGTFSFRLSPFSLHLGRQILVVYSTTTSLRLPTLSGCTIVW